MYIHISVTKTKLFGCLHSCFGNSYFTISFRSNLNLELTVYSFDISDRSLKKIIK